VSTSVIDQVESLFAQPLATPGLASESSLRVAAAMLSRAPEHEMTATRVIGTLGQDDADAFDALLRAVAREYRLEVTYQLSGGSFAVRFYR
jgi:hypothetical protein